MRPTMPFDPRLQPVGMYVNPTPQPYRPPLMATAPAQSPLPQMTTFSQPYPLQPHQVYSPPQPVYPQIVNPPPQPAAQPSMQQSNAYRGQPVQPGPQPEVHYGVAQGYEGEQPGEDEEEMKNQQIIMFWEHKFYTVLERFQLIYEKIQNFRVNFQALNEELRAVDSEEQWMDAKEHHEDFMEQLQQFTQELGGVLSENTTLAEQIDNEAQEEPLWKSRYFQLFEGYKAMEEELNQFKNGNFRQDAPNSYEDKKYEELVNNYKMLEREYSQAVNQLNETRKNTGGYESHTGDKASREKVEYALKEAEKYKEMLEQLSKQNEELDHLNNQLRGELENVETNTHETFKQHYSQFEMEIHLRDQKIEELNNELGQLSERYNSLVEAHNALQGKLMNEDPRLKGRLTDMEQQLEVKLRELEAKNKQVLETRGKILDLQLKQKRAQSSSEQYQRLLSIRSGEIQEKNEEIIRLRNQISNSLTHRRNESDKDATSYRREQEAKIKKVQQQYEQKIEGLKQKLRKKEAESQSLDLLNIKVESLEKKNKMLLVEIETLNKELTTKEQQSLEYRRIGNTGDRARELETQYNIVLEEKQHLNGVLLQRNYEMDNLQAQINQFESRIRDLSNKTNASGSKSLMLQIDELNNIIHSKQSEINRLKSNLGLKEGLIAELEAELEKAKNSLISSQKVHEVEKDTLNESIRSLQRRNQENQKKMRDLEYQFGSAMRKNLEDEIRSLRSQNQSRQETIIRLEAEELELRSRISHYERVRGTHSNDLEELAIRIKDLESSKYEMIKKVQNSYRDVKKKQKQNKELVDSAKELRDKIIKLEATVTENERLITEKNKIIENLQGQVLVTNSRLSYITEEHDNLRLRRRDETDLFMKQSDNLRRKIFQYEHLNDTKQQFQDKFSSQIVKLQNELIQQLKQEKQFLKSQLAAALDKLGELPNFNQKPGSLRKSKASEGIDYIQKRLFDFNSKLDDMIVKNKQLNGRGFGSNIENWASPQVGSQAAQEQVRNLKNQIQELRRYISRLEVQAAGETIRFNPRNELISAEQDKTYQERLEFYQNQTNELEARNEDLIKVNKSLKERVDSLLKGDNSNLSSGFYKQQLAISEETIDSLNGKVKRLSEENRVLKSNNNQATTKICREYEDKIFEFENKIFALERRVNGLELQKTKIENEKIGLQRSLNLVQTELYSIKVTAEKQSNLHKVSNKELEEQVVSLESELADLMGRIRLLESENERLGQAMHTSYSQQHILINTPVKATPAKASVFQR